MMKKLLNTITLILCGILISTCVLGNETYNAKVGINRAYTPAEGSIEELYKDMLVTELEPYISKVIQEKYGKTLQYDLFDIEFLNIQREAYRSFSFILKLQVKPFVGAHNTIGIDNITISISPYGTKVTQFEHLKSFPIPPWLEDNYKDLKLKYTS